ncbi:hypothetical protein ACRFE0_25655, partial [Klebsiella pneumoniae]
KACVLPENPASYRVVRTKSYLFNKACTTSLSLHSSPVLISIGLSKIIVLSVIFGMSCFSKEEF